MTKSERRFRLEAPLTQGQLASISDIHGIYGILHVAPAGEDGLEVQYDASRMGLKEVEAALRRAGISVRQA